MRVAIIGRTQLLYETAVALARAGHEIATVITARAAPEYTRTEEDFRELAASLGASFHLTQTLETLEVRAACAGVDLAISVNWVSVIHERHLRLFRLGILNAHSGDLPRYRGNACPNWAILLGETEITVSVHFMEGGRLDCGRVVAQEVRPLGSNENIGDVYEWYEETVPTMFVATLARLTSDPGYEIKYADPASVGSFRCYPRIPEDAFIDWENSAEDIHNLVRAAGAPFAGAYTYQRVRADRVEKLIVIESRLGTGSDEDLAVPGQVLENDLDSGESMVKCGSGVIRLLKCRYEGEEEEFRPGERWRSIRVRLGVRAEDWLWVLAKGRVQ